MENSTSINQSINSRGGPSTTIGKSISAMNALKHGATSKHFLNNEEKKQYEEICESLEETYPSSNPLVSMQIKRLAHLHVSLDRINNVINAKFELNRTDSTILSNLEKRLGLNSFEKSQITDIYLGKLNIKELESRTEKKLFDEFPIMLMQKKIETQQEFLEKMPKPKFNHQN